MLWHGSQIRPQLSVAGPTNRPQPKVKIPIVIIKLKLWPATGCETKVAAELSSHPYNVIACHEGVIKRFESLNFQNAPVELKLDLKYTCDILTMIKHMLCYIMSLRCHKGVKGQVPSSEVKFP